MENYNGKMLFAWIVGLILFLWMGYFGGYFVATNEAMDALERRERVWKREAETIKKQISNRQAEVDKAESAATEAHNEMIALHRQAEELKRELDRAKAAAAESLTRMNDLKAMVNLDRKGVLTLNQVRTAKEAFNTLKREVAAGNFKGLDLTSGYQILNSVFGGTAATEMTRPD